MTEVKGTSGAKSLRSKPRHTHTQSSGDHRGILQIFCMPFLTSLTILMTQSSRSTCAIQSSGLQSEDRKINKIKVPHFKDVTVPMKVVFVCGEHGILAILLSISVAQRKSIKLFYKATALLGIYFKTFFLR